MMSELQILGKEMDEVLDLLNKYYPQYYDGFVQQIHVPFSNIIKTGTPYEVEQRGVERLRRSIGVLRLKIRGIFERT